MSQKLKILKQQYQEMKNKTENRQRLLEKLKTGPEPYSKVYLLKAPDLISLSNNQNYKVSISVVLLSQNVHTVNCKFCRGAGLSFVPKNATKADWIDALQAVKELSLRSTTNHKVSVIGTVLLNPRMKATSAKVVFGVVGNLAVALLRTRFIDNFVRRILATVRKNCVQKYQYSTINRHHNQYVERIEQEGQEADIVEMIAVLEEEFKASQLIYVVRQTILRPKSEGVDLVMTKVRGLIQVHTLPDWDFMNTKKAAIDILYMFPNRPFYSRISKTRHHCIC